MEDHKVFEVKNGVIQNTTDHRCFQRASVVDGGYSSFDGGFWALLRTTEDLVFSVGIKDAEVYDTMLQAYLSNEEILISL